MKKFVLYFYGTEYLWEDANGDLYGYAVSNKTKIHFFKRII